VDLRGKSKPKVTKGLRADDNRSTDKGSRTKKSTPASLQQPEDEELDLARENAQLKSMLIYYICNWMYLPSHAVLVRNLMARTKQDVDVDASIVKPCGSVGSKAYKLQDHMQLGDDKDLYKKILVRAGLDARARGTYIQDSEAFATSATRLVLTLAFRTPNNRWCAWGSCSPP
jgi:hypothetical protein